MQINDIIEGKTKSKKPQKPKQNNPVAKHSRNMSGAGAHTTKKDYDRKAYDINKDPSINEGEERSIIANACVEKLVDAFGESPGLFADNQEELIQKMYSDLEAMDVQDVVDPTMEVGGQPIGNFASGRVIDVINPSDVIDNALQHVNLADLEEAKSKKSEL